MRRFMLLLLALLGIVSLAACSLGGAATPEAPTRVPPLPTAEKLQPTRPAMGVPAPTLSADSAEPLATIERAPTDAAPIDAAPTDAVSKFITDDFSDPASGWLVDEIAEGSVKYAQGTYVIEVKPKLYTIWSHPGLRYDDVAVAVSARPIDLAADTELGVLCRYRDGKNFIYASISSDGYYGIGQMKDGEATLLTGNGKLQPSGAILTGDALNRIQLVCDSDQFTLIVNDQRVDTAQIETAARGDVGVLAGTFDQPNAAARFDNFATSAPQLASSVPAKGPGKQVLLQDDFSDPQSGWDVRETTNGASGYGAKRYFIRVDQPKYQLWSVPGQIFKGDVVVEVTAGLNKGPADSEMGVICRYQDKENFVYGSVGSDGYYSIVEIKNNQVEILTGKGKYVQSGKIPTGAASYHIRLACEGDTYTLFVNDTKIDSVTRQAGAAGDVGLLVGTFDKGGVEVLFDDFLVSSP